TKFAEFQSSLGIAPNILGERLTRLADEGIFERVLYCERPARHEYRLTQKGSDLFVGLNALRQWGDTYLCQKPMRLLRQRSDGKPVVAALIPEGAPSLTNDQIELVPGSGFPDERAHIADEPRTHL
ncbi:MAG TPA: helix-turn-helix domain-containing protein, partial [Gaiellaceae bacterium]|nr:helix-turn-helix domain-containing protein [Gaiellaceae bacterium]